MALIKCPECGKEVSDRAEMCPQCGYPIDENVFGIEENITKEVYRDGSKTEFSSLKSHKIEGYIFITLLTVVIVCILIGRSILKSDEPKIITIDEIANITEYDANDGKVRLTNGVVSLTDQFELLGIKGTLDIVTYDENNCIKQIDFVSSSVTTEEQFEYLFDCLKDKCGEDYLTYNLIEYIGYSWKDVNACDTIELDRDVTKEGQFAHIRFIY